MPRWKMEGRIKGTFYFIEKRSAATSPICVIGAICGYLPLPSHIINHKSHIEHPLPPSSPHLRISLPSVISPCLPSRPTSCRPTHRRLCAHHLADFSTKNRARPHIAYSRHSHQLQLIFSTLNRARARKPVVFTKGGGAICFESCRPTTRTTATV